MTVVVTCAVEGLVDEAVARRLAQVAGAEPGPIHVANGKDALLARLAGYSAAAAIGPWLVLVDLDRDAECAPPFVRDQLAAASPSLYFRVAVRAVEAWFLADRERFAHFLDVSAARLPRDPDAVEDPKRLVVDLARVSRKREIREGLVPREGSGRSVGPLYTGHLIQFASVGWRPGDARGRSDSLDRCLRRLEGLVSTAA